MELYSQQRGKRTERKTYFSVEWTAGRTQHAMTSLAETKSKNERLAYNCACNTFGHVVLKYSEYYEHRARGPIKGFTRLDTVDRCIFLSHITARSRSFKTFNEQHNVRVCIAPSPWTNQATYLAQHKKKGRPVEKKLASQRYDWVIYVDHSDSEVDVEKRFEVLMFHTPQNHFSLSDHFGWSAPFQLA